MTASDPDRASITARMRGLYRLAFHACGASHRAVQRSIGRDVRSMMAANDIPTLACVIDLARALGMRPAVAVELLVGSIVERQGTTASAVLVARDGPSTESVDDSCLDDPILVAADLADDDALLEHHLRRIPPERDVVHAALLARIFAARGSIDRAVALIRGAHPENLDRRAARFLSTAIGEIALVRPEALDVVDPCARVLFRRPHRAQRRAGEIGADVATLLHALEVRDDFHHGTIRALRTRDRSEALAILQDLADRLDDVRRSENHCATAWAASITALTALAILSGERRELASNARTRRIAVQAGFALEDVTRCGDPIAERLACTRRARVVLAERAVRAACGEDPVGLVDASDLAEIAAAILRFPEADPSLHPFRYFRTFSQPGRSGLDGVATTLRMNARSRCARGVACAHP